MTDPIWSDGTKFAAVPLTVLAGLLVVASLLTAASYFSAKRKYLDKLKNVDERYARAKTFTVQMRSRVLAERRVTEVAQQQIANPNIDPADVYVSSYVDDWEIREAYETAFTGEDYFADFQGRGGAKEPDFGDDYGPSVFGLPVVAAVILGIVWWGMYPLDSRYHQWRVVQGEVTSVGGERIQGTDSGDLFVSWVFDINDKQYTCEETRCGSIEVGDTAKLRCKPRYQYVGSEINECKFVSVRSS